jgi:hypothetical protein
MEITSLLVSCNTPGCGLNTPVDSTMLHFFGFFQYSVKVLATYNFAHMKNTNEAPYVDMIGLRTHLKESQSSWCVYFKKQV